MAAKKRGKSSSPAKSGASSKKQAARKAGSAKKAASRKTAPRSKSKKAAKSAPRKSESKKKAARKQTSSRASNKKTARRPLLVETARYYDENEEVDSQIHHETHDDADHEIYDRNHAADIVGDSEVQDDTDADREDDLDYDESVENEDREKFMGVGDHLEELRRRLLGIIGVVVVGAGIAGFFVQDIHTFLSEPYRTLTGRSLYLATVYGPLETLIKLSITLGVSISLPLSFFILWGFVTPALGRRGAITGNVSILTSSFLFWGGMVFCWFYVFPLSLQFMFTSILPAGTEPQITLEKYYSFFFLVHIGAGLAFQLPLIVIVLGALGVFPLAWHKTAYKYVLVGISIFAALITDPNPLTQLAMGGMLTGLYAISLGILWVIERGRRLKG